jgi:hypothetical protein
VKGSEQQMKSATISLDDLNYQIRPKNGETVDEVLQRYAWFRTYLETIKKQVCNKK